MSFVHTVRKGQTSQLQSNRRPSASSSSSSLSTTNSSSSSLLSHHSPPPTPTQRDAKRTKLQHSTASSGDTTSMASTTELRSPNFDTHVSPSSASPIHAAPMSDANSLLRQAALDRAARSRRTPSLPSIPALPTHSRSSSFGAVHPSTSSSNTSSNVTPRASAEAETLSLVLPLSASNSASPAIRPFNAPTHLRLKIGSPPEQSGKSTIGTPVVYTGPSQSPNPMMSAWGNLGGSPSELSLCSSPSSATSSGPSSKSPSNTIACPLCDKKFARDDIEAHASRCDGTDSSLSRPSPTSFSAAAASYSSRQSSGGQPHHRSVGSTTTSRHHVACFPATTPLSRFATFDQVKILTWNVWFDDLKMAQRMEAIGSVIEKESPLIVAFQEVTEESFDMIRKSQWAKHYFVTPRTDCRYFTVLCVKLPPLSSRRIPFSQSDMARDLLSIIVDVPTADGGRRKLTVATSHLESEHRRKAVRRLQLEEALSHLSAAKQGTSTAVYCGDMNLNGSECEDIVQRFQWTDSWMASHPGTKASDKNAMTFDTQTNPMLASSMRPGSTFKARLDRMWIRFGKGEVLTVPSSPATLPPSVSSLVNNQDWRLVSVERVGLCAIDLSQPSKYSQKDYKNFESKAAASKTSPSETSSSTPATIFHSIFSGASSSSSSSTPIFPSDHFGLLMTLQVVPASMPDQKEEERA